MRLEMDVATFKNRKHGRDEIDVDPFQKREHARGIHGMHRVQDLHSDLSLDQLGLDSSEKN